MYRWQQVKALRAQGFHVKQIARRLDLSRNTVKKYLRSAEPPEFHAREYVKKSDLFIDDIKGMIGKGYIGTRIHEELMNLGFVGSLSSVERVIHTIKKEKERKEKITTRVETPPGPQMQYDWKGVGVRAFRIINARLASLPRQLSLDYSSAHTARDHSWRLRHLCSYNGYRRSILLS